MKVKLLDWLIGSSRTYHINNISCIPVKVIKNEINIDIFIFSADAKVYVM